MGLCERSKARPQDVGGGEGVHIWTVAVADHRKGMVLQLGSLGEGIAIFHPKNFVTKWYMCSWTWDRFFERSERRNMARNMRLQGHVVRMRERRKTCRILVEKHVVGMILRYGLKLDDVIKIDLKEIRCEGLD